MRKIFLFLFLVFVVSCNKNSNIGGVNGLYTENTPVAGRSQLNFINSNLVVKSETGSSYKDTFSFSISTGKILLTPTWTTRYSGHQIDFEIIDDNTFKIQNLYPSLPESPKSYMIFKK